MLKTMTDLDYKDRDGYEKQKNLVERFINKGDKVALKMIFNRTYNNKKVKEKSKKKMDFFGGDLKLERKNSGPFNSTTKNKLSKGFGNLFYNFADPLSYDENGFDFNSNINNYRINLHELIQDPEYKSKSMKGNYKWGLMRFNMMKLNWAKRRGVSIENFELPKLESFKRKKMMIKMDGEYITSNRHNNKKYLYNTYSNFNKNNEYNYS